MRLHQNIFLIFLLASTSTHAQTTVEDLKDDLTQAAVEEKVSKDAPIGVGFLSQLLKKNIPSENVCLNKKQVRKSGKTQLILLVELAPLFHRSFTNQNADPSSFTLPKQANEPYSLHPYPFSMQSEDFTYDNFEDHVKRANQYFEALLLASHHAVGENNYQIANDPEAIRYRDFGTFVETLALTLANEYKRYQSDPAAQKAADQLAFAKAGQLINLHFKTEDEKMFAIAAINEKLYWGYNEAKNPLANNSKNNPNHIPLTPGYIGPTQQAYAATSDEVIYGDNCNGYSITAALEGKSLSSRDGILRDNLTLEQSGFGGVFHFAAAISDGKKVNVFAGEGLTQYDKRFGLGMWAAGDASKNFRVQQVSDDGTQKDIFVGDSSYGTYLKKLVDADNPYDLKVTPDLPIALVKAVKDLSEKRKAEYGLSTTELLNRSKIIAVFASYDTEGKWVDNNFSGAVTNQFAGANSVIRFHVDEKFMVKHVFHIDSNRAKLESTNFWIEGGARAGLEVGVQIGKKTVNDPRANLPEYTGNFEANVGAGVEYENKENGIKVLASVRESLPVGSKNWEGMSGKGIAKNLTLIPNITTANLDLEKTLGKDFKLASSFKYTGTQVGQNLNAGLRFTSPGNVKIVTYVGYTQRFKGMGKFGTNFNYLENDQGGLNTSVSAESKNKGFNACFQATGLTPTQTGTVSENANFRISLSKTLDFKKKKNK